MDKEDVIYIYTHTHTHNGILLSHKKSESLTLATTWMDLEGIMLPEINQRQILYVTTYMWNLKNKTDKRI